MTVEELLNRFDDLVSAVERVADGLDARAQEVAAVEVERFAALFLDELLGPLPTPTVDGAIFHLREAVADALQRFEKDDGR